MPLVNNIGSNNYVKVTRVYVNSDEDQDGENPDNLLVKLQTPVKNPIAIECKGYNIPNTAAPTFITGSNDRVDFYLQDVDNDVTRIKTITFPQEQFSYYNSSGSGLSYIDFLETSINTIIEADDYFGAGTLFALFAHVFERDDFKTELEIDSDEASFRWGFLFASGPNSSRSAYKQMGFDKQDYYAEDPDDLYWWTIVSPYTTIMLPYRYVDIIVDEAREFRPLLRIFFLREGYLQSNDYNASRTRYITSDPVNELRYLTIRPTLDDGSPLPTSRAYNLEFVIYSLSPEVHVPKYINDYFII